ncbi:MAG TPA: ABC transporter C-terminal domain-containing protein, partial [Caulobacteraceae bacterium]
DGHGRVVETPGGWNDFVTQNPGFFTSVSAVTSPEAKLAPRRERSASVKLSYRDERRLAELEKELPRLADRIADLEHRLADPDLYARDPDAFDRVSGDLADARRTQAEAEDAWLDLEARREALALGATPGSA